MRFKLSLLGLAASVMLLPGTVLAACETITLGSAISLTGKYATNGMHAKNGYEFAIQKIKDAGGVEVFAIGVMNDEGLVGALEIHCRGNKGAVPALLSRPRPGEVVIHNHPSGVLEASHADMYLANLYGEDGVGVVIVDNAVERALWVVEPHRRELHPVEAAEI